MKQFPISRTRPFLPLAMSLVALTQWSEGQTVTLAEWTSFPASNTAPATASDPLANPSDIVYNGSNVFNSVGSIWTLEVNNGSTDYTAVFNITPVAGAQLTLESIAFYWAADVETTTSTNSFTIASSTAGSEIYYEGTTNPVGLEGTHTFTFGTAITLDSGQSETFTWTFGHANGGSNVRADLANISVQGTATIPEPSHAVILTGLMAFYVTGHRRRSRR